MERIESLVEVTERGLIIKKPLNEAEWQAVGLKLARAGRAYRWQIGDWWRAYRGNEAARVQILRELDMDMKTVQNIASVCAAYPLEERFPELAISYHEAVMTLPRDVRRRLLTQALKEGLTVSELRKMAQAELARLKRTDGAETPPRAAPVPPREPEPETEEEAEEEVLVPARVQTRPYGEKATAAPAPSLEVSSGNVRPSEGGDGYEHALYPNVARVLFRGGRILLWNPSARMTPGEARALAEVLLVAAQVLEAEEVAVWR
ncbi:hypothetical protein [Fervidobacterium sp.]